MEGGREGGRGERERERENSIAIHSNITHSHDSSDVGVITGDGKHLALLNQRFGEGSVGVVIKSKAPPHAEVLVGDSLRSIAVDDTVRLRDEGKLCHKRHWVNLWRGVCVLGGE